MCVRRLLCPVSGSLVKLPDPPPSIKTLFVSRDNMIWLNEFSAKFSIESKEDTHIIELVNLAIVLLDNP